ncbi:LOW QUALITY PROTEIN: OR8G1 isoform 1 [Pan troglodytes]|uniref:OR8G1 isoform 1 n=1 Tax=Pan troglodytes TaxID=9598 RepID=A0A2J8N1S0_PANTR|nr:LOW QUALITY PROTEIN: OR8G1 isoform 1 [Pan troglodytes]
MSGENNSSVTEFILAGLSEQPELQLRLFLLFLGIYVVTVVGNLGMTTLIGLSSHLHTPMYYFPSIYVNKLLILCVGAFNILVPSLTILCSYIFIIASILHIRSTEGRSKAFSTYSSHMLVVVIFFGSAAFMYLQPSSVSSMDQGKVSSVFYTIIVLLNPLIYSLRNKDVHVSLKKMLQRRTLL